MAVDKDPVVDLKVDWWSAKGREPEMPCSCNGIP